MATTFVPRGRKGIAVKDMKKHTSPAANALEAGKLKEAILVVAQKLDVDAGVTQDDFEAAATSKL